MATWSPTRRGWLRRLSSPAANQWSVTDGGRFTAAIAIRPPTAANVAGVSLCLFRLYSPVGRRRWKNCWGSASSAADHYRAGRRRACQRVVWQRQVWLVTADGRGVRRCGFASGPRNVVSRKPSEGQTSLLTAVVESCEMLLVVVWWPLATQSKTSGEAPAQVRPALLAGMIRCQRCAVGMCTVLSTACVIWRVNARKRRGS